jgi:hypothetical protein
MKFAPLTITAFLGLLFAPVPAPCADSEPGDATHGIESAIAGIDMKQLEKLIREKFSHEDVRRLSRYLKDLVAGGRADLPRDLKGKFDDLVSELRLEYGFQIAVLMAELEKAAKRLLQEGIDVIPRRAPDPRSI